MKGFTLIELMVVISIVGVFASVVLTSLNEVRLDAQNVHNNQIAHQYATALISFRLDNGHYPNVVPPVMGNCLGDFDDDACNFFNSDSELPSINSDLITYYPRLPVHYPVEFLPGMVFEGPLYRCTDLGASLNCTEAEVFWLLHKTNQTCAANAVAASAFNSTSCTLTFE